MKMRKGFTMVELLFVIVLLGWLGFQLTKSDNERTEKDKINEMYQNIASIVDTAIYNPNKGYASDKGGYCSSNYDVYQISAARVSDCNNLSLKLTRGSTDTDGKDSYFSFLPFLSTDGIGCKLYIDDESAYGIALFLDCSKVKYAAKIEQSFTAFIREKEPIAFKGYYAEATDITTNTGGTKADGKVKIILEK